MDEIYTCIAPKKANYLHGTITTREYEVMSEANSYLSLINYSCLQIEEIARLWEETNLKYQ